MRCVHSCWNIVSKLALCLGSRLFATSVYDISMRSTTWSSLVVESKPVSIIADETTDVCDHGVLNVIATVRGKPYLIGAIIELSVKPLLTLDVHAHSEGYSSCPVYVCVSVSFLPPRTSRPRNIGTCTYGFTATWKNFYNRDFR